MSPTPPATPQQLFALGLQHHQTGNLAEAETFYRQVLSAQPNHADAWHYLGVIAHQSGRPEIAEKMILKAIALNPSNPGAHSNLGVLYCQTGRIEEAMASYRRALQLQPDFPDFSNNLGMALFDRGQFDAAAEAFLRAAQLKADYAEAWFNLGNTRRRQDRFEEAIEAYGRALQSKPDHAESHNNLGLALLALDRIEESATAYRRALQLNPRHEFAWYNLGNALKLQNRLDEAIAAFRRAVEINPDFASGHNNLGISLAEQGRSDEALAPLQRAVQLDPHYAAACNNLGNVFKGQGRVEEALAAYRRAIDLQPDYATAHYNLGNVLSEQGQLDEAAASFHRALHSQPDLADAYTSLGTTLKDQGRLDEALGAYRQAITLKPLDSLVLGNLAYTLHFHPAQDDAAIAEVHRGWNQRFARPLQPFLRPHANLRDPERRLRIGYVSPDFRQHVVGRNLVPLFRHHDAGRFEILCYAGVTKPDALTDEYRRRVAQWRSTVDVADETLAGMIREDGVDILVDLTQHMADNRLALFARQPAPVQVSFAGYPASAGVEAIGYRISDRYLESEIGDGRSEIGAEQVCLIDSFWCYDACGFEARLNESPARERGYVTFGSLNNFCKINEPVLRLWARVLQTVKDSRLIMLSPVGSHRQRVLEILDANGAEAHRVEFVAPLPYVAYLERHHQIDIALDSFPYNGHTTNLDALWMGVPVVSLVGGHSVSRAGLSQLSHLGLAELAAFSEDDYVASAARLAHDLPRLAELRANLRARMKAGRLTDTVGFARQIEAAFRTMWQWWCAGS